SLAAWHAVTQGLLHPRQDPSQGCFIQPVSEPTIPGDADQGGKIPPQIVHGPDDRIRHPCRVQEDAVVRAIRIIVEVRLVLEAVKAQQLHPLAIYLAEDLQRWSAIAPAIALLQRRAEAARLESPRGRRWYGVAHRLLRAGT